MRIAIDISPRLNDHKYRGIGIYTKLLIEALQKYEGKHTVELIDNKSINVDSVDIIHYPFFDPFFLTLPLHKLLPTIVTVHDLIPIVFPDKFSRGIRGEIKWMVQKYSLQTSSAIITDSENSKNDINQKTGYPKKNISVIQLAQAPFFVPLQSPRVISKYSLPNSYLLYVGDVNWNKNVTGLFYAFAKVKKISKFKNLHLVLVGSAFLNDNLPESRHLHQIAKQLDIKDSVIELGLAEDDDLATIYSHAYATIVPSYYEGFGLPLLEAMACGCPVVVSGNSSLIEIAGPSILINPYDREDITRGIIKVMELTQDEYKKLSNASIQWSKKFSWKSVARQTVEVYESVLYAA